MTKYFQITRPVDNAIPVVVDIPHAGEWIPPAVEDEMTLGSRPPRRDLDLYTDIIYGGAADGGATLIQSRVSRYVIDLNRAADDVSSEAVDGAEAINQPGYYRERGVVWRTATDGTPVIARPMTAEAYARRIDLFWKPYHEALAAEIERVRNEFGYCILVDGHSMPSLGRRATNRRADVVPGDLDGQSCSRFLLRTVIRHYRQLGYSVRPNNPYKGGWITRTYGEPSRGVHAIQIEVNRDLYMNERTFRIRDEGISKLTDACTSLIERLGELRFDS